MKRFAAQYVYTLTSREPLRNAFVEVEEDGSVLRIGPCEEGEERMEGAIVPGFVNAHCHVELSYMKGLFRKGTGMAGFIDQINALRDSFSPEDKLAFLREAMDDMWEQGVVAMADISNCDDSFAVKAAHPMYTRTFLEVFGAHPAECQEVMHRVRALQEKAQALGLDAAPTPHSCYTMSPDLVTASSVAGLESGYLSFHSEESEEEEEMMMFGRGPMWDNRKANGIPTPPVTGTTSLEYFLNRILAGGLRAPVPGHVLLVHECCLVPEGALLAKKVLQEPFLAVCPLSNLFIHKMLPPIPVMRESGIPICVGTDSLSSNDALCMVDELYCLQQAFPEVTLGELLEWACLNGARFLGKEDVLGTLEPGKNPGLVYISSCHAARGEASPRLTAQSKSHRL
ncbi:MAG: amidohydrolase family protein [Bacteroidales bacterium]|nr:amidohydrolase family protein [Bacteroidales bacterium]